jgi:hypothetical protein
MMADRYNERDTQRQVDEDTHRRHGGETKWERK